MVAVAFIIGRIEGASVRKHTTDHFFMPVR